MKAMKTLHWEAYVECDSEIYTHTRDGDRDRDRGRLTYIQKYINLVYRDNHPHKKCTIELK